MHFMTEKARNRYRLEHLWATRHISQPEPKYDPETMELDDDELAPDLDEDTSYVSEKKTSPFKK